MQVNAGRIVIAILSCIFVSTICQAQLLSSDEIIKLHEEGRSSAQIIQAIQERGLGFEVTLPVLETMISKGVSQGVLEVLLGNDPGRSHSKPVGISMNKPPRAGVTVFTDPPGLNLTIDGKPQGVTPYLSNKLSRGTHLFKVSHPLFFARQEEVSFDGEKPLELNWQMEPREPIIRLNVKIDRGTSNQPWSWIVRPRSQCPGCQVDAEFKAWKSVTRTGEAIFLLTDDAKRRFRGDATGCLELNIWEGEVRRDLPIRRLPPPIAKYYITDIQIDGIRTVDISIDIRVKELSKENLEISLAGDSGYLIKAELGPDAKSDAKRHEELIETLDGLVQ